MKFISLLLFSLFILTGVQVALSEPELKPVLTQDNDLILDPLVYNGTKSLAEEFPSMGWVGNCTGTVVADNVIFTAGHCKSTGSNITFKHKADGKNYSATCTRHPQYNTSTIFNDFTLCKTTESFPSGTVMGSFDIVTAPSVGDNMLINGYGLPNSGTHYWGKAPMTRISGQDIVTCGPANLGSGDSGGSLLKWTEDRTGKTGFTIVGVNSRGGGGCSFYNKIASDEFRTWAKQYETDKGVQLCGVSKTCSGNTPPPPPPPPLCEAMYADLSVCMITNVHGSCLQLYTNFKQCLKL